MLNQDFMIQALILTRQLLTVLFDLKELGFRLESYQKKQFGVKAKIYSYKIYIWVSFGGNMSSNFVTGVKSQK